MYSTFLTWNIESVFFFTALFLLKILLFFRLELRVNRNVPLTFLTMKLMYSLSHNARRDFVVCCEMLSFVCSTAVTVVHAHLYEQQF